MFSVVFPGQGSQKLGMAKEFFDKFELVKKLFYEADEILNLPGADTTQCLQAGDIQSICLEYPNYLIDPSPVLYKDSQNLNDNWTEAFGGVRFRFDNARNIYDTSIGYEIDIKAVSYTHLRAHETDS